MLACQVADLVWHVNVSVPFPVSIRRSSELLTNLLEKCLIPLKVRVGFVVCYGFGWVHKILSNSPRSKIYIWIASGFPMLPILFVCLQKQVGLPQVDPYCPYFLFVYKHNNFIWYNEKFHFGSLAYQLYLSGCINFSSL